MKKIIMFIIFCFVTSNMFSLNIDSVTNIKGYYVTIYLKQEIIFSYEQQIKKEERKSYSTPIGYKQYSFFIPTQVGNKIVCKKDMIFKKIHSNILNDSIYLVPNMLNENLLERLNIVISDFSKEICILKNGVQLSPYYEIDGDSNTLFKFVYIEGFAQHKYIRDIDEKWQNYLLNICTIDKYNKNAEFFFISKICMYTPYVKLPKFKKWLPYIN